MQEIEKLTKLMNSFPGVGPRQSRRFVYFLLQKNPRFREELANSIKDIKNKVKQCPKCQRFFSSEYKNNECLICLDENRENELMIVHRDVDLDSMEKSNFYKGYYFVLGGSVPIMEKNPEKFLRIDKLFERIDKLNPKEIIMAFHLNPEGENTSNYLIKKLREEKSDFELSTLGRGMSTGLEIEYADSDTIKSALQNRNKKL